MPRQAQIHDEEPEAGDNITIANGGPLFHKSKKTVPRSQPDLKLYFSQFHGKLGDNEVFEGDLISSMQFNPTGDLLGVGDRGGRITIYKRHHQRPSAENNYEYVNYKPYLVFQSHDPEFDYLKSIEIEEKITQLSWVPRSAHGQFLLAANDRTIKLWNVNERSVRSSSEAAAVNLNPNTKNKSINSALVLPRIVKTPAQATATLRKLYGNAHNYHINTLSVNSDQETFLSSDDLRINLWNMEITDQSFTIVDIKPENMDFLQEVITTSVIDPSKCSIFAYGTSKGIVKLCDMRTSALCDKHAKQFHVPPNESESRGMFSEIIESICDVKFSKSGRFIATRNYSEVKIWDTQMESKPVSTFQLHSFLANHLYPVYENDSIFDKFNISWNGSESRLVSGSYNNMFYVMEQEPSQQTVLLEAPRDSKIQTLTQPQSNAPKVPLKPRRVVERATAVRNGKRGRVQGEVLLEDVDFSKKSLLTEWHPKEDILAIAGTNNLYLFQDKIFN